MFTVRDGRDRGRALRQSVPLAEQGDLVLRIATSTVLGGRDRGMSEARCRDVAQTAYADRSERDFAALDAAVRSGRLRAERGV